MHGRKKHLKKRIKIDTMAFLALLPVDFLVCLFFKTWATETCLSCYIWSLCMFVVHWNVHAKYSSFFPHIIYGNIWLQLSLLLVHNYGYLHNTKREFKYQNHVNSGILWQCLVTSYWPSGYSAFSWGSIFICWSVNVRPQRSNTVLELMSSGLHSCAFIVNRYITKAST
jgi:hypothetical protein